MELNDLTILTHTHTDCNDLWGPYFDSYKTFFNLKKHLVLINEKTQDIDLEQIVYDEKIKYSDRLILSLKLIETKYVIISFEDMILYGDVVVDKLKLLIKELDKNDDFLFVRLIKSGINSNNIYGENLYELTNTDFHFSITPTIWNREKLLSILENNLRGLNIWELEEYGNSTLLRLNVKGLYYFNNEPKRGGHHDSSIYPHICSAIFKGKWNFREYQTELTPIFNKYKINIYERGIF